MIWSVIKPEQNSFCSFGYCTVISYIFSICTANAFGCFCGVMVQFELVKDKFQNLISLHSHMWCFQITHGLRQCTKCQRTTFYKTTNHTQVLCHGLNCFGRVIYSPHTNTYQNIAKLFNHPSRYNHISTFSFTFSLSLSFFLSFFLPISACLIIRIKTKISRFNLYLKN